MEQYAMILINRYCFIYSMRVYQYHSMVVITKILGNDKSALDNKNAKLDNTCFTLTMILRLHVLPE